MIPKYRQIEKRSWQDAILQIIFCLLVLTIAGFLVVSNFRIYGKRAALNSQVGRLKEEIRLLEEKKQNFQAQLDQSKQEEYLEKEVREKLNLKKPGEEVVAVLPAEEKPEQEEAIKQWWNPLTW